MLMSEVGLEKSIGLAEASGLFVGLERVYSDVPSGQCTGCTQCCSESVNAFYIEFLNIWRRLKKDPARKRRLMPRILRYYMLEMVERASCPFLDDDGRCAVYSERPLVCRQFGHWSRKAFGRNIEAVLQANRDAADFYRTTYGLVLPEAAVNKTMAYCEAFQAQRKIGPIRRGEQTDAVFALDLPFLQEKLLNESLIGIPLVTWFIYTVFDPEEAGTLRLKVMHEFLDHGASETLDTLLRCDFEVW